MVYQRKNVKNNTMKGESQKAKGGRRKKKVTASGAGTERKAKISWTVKPENMTQEEWQRALRRQLAEEETFGIESVDEKLSPGEYIVRSPKSKQEYKVVYRGEASKWNYCSCMDFKTSQLGTCKHIEAVNQWISGSRRRRVHEVVPPYTSVYLS